MHHGNIVRLLAVVIDDLSDQAIGFIMEYVPKSLEQVMLHLTVPQVIHVMAEVALGMAVAHDQSIIHSDMKPGNILVSADLRRCSSPIAI